MALGIFHDITMLYIAINCKSIAPRQVNEQMQHLRERHIPSNCRETTGTNDMHEKEKIPLLTLPGNLREKSFAKFQRSKPGTGIKARGFFADALRS